MTRTTCPYCGVGCGVVVDADAQVVGDPDHPANRGRLCSKGSALSERLDDGERLLDPRIGEGAAGWDEALSLVADRFLAVIREHGPESVAFYGSGQFLTEDYYVANKLMKGFVGGANMDTNSRLCMASTVSGHVRAFGEDIVPGTYADWDETDLAVLVGSNTAWCHPVLHRRLLEARARRGTRVVVIDPRRTATCEAADLHLPLAPGGDVALFAGLLSHLAAVGSLDEDWIAAHTTGFERALAEASDFADRDRLAAVTRLQRQDIETFFDWFAQTERVMTVFSQGVNQSSAGSDKVNAIINCHLATGRIGRPGMGPFSVTGQPNAMGGREVGGLANQLAAHMGFSDPADLSRVQRFWNAPALARKPGLKAIELFDAVADGRIKAVWIMATNPAVSLPRADRVRAALQACPFVVVSDCWETDTTALADVVLPAAAWGEKDGTVTNSERRISRQRAFRPAPGLARPDWWILSEVARRMGFADAFAYGSPADIFREHAALSGFENDGARVFDIGRLAALSDAEYDALAPVRWPLPTASSSSEGAVPSEDGRLFADGRFPTADGRARFVATAWRPPAARTNRRRPFLLNTGRVRDQWHTMTRTGRIRRLMSHQDEPFLDIAPADARMLGLVAGDLVRIETEHAASVLRARPSEGQRRGEIFAPMHWTRLFCSAGPADRLVDAAFDPLSGQPELKATAARLAPIPTLWRGLLFRPAERMPEGEFYCCRIPIEGGHVFELQGWEPLPADAALARWGAALLADQGVEERIELDAPTEGAYRLIGLESGRFRSGLFLSSRSNRPLPSRDWLQSQIGAVVDDALRAALLEISVAETAKSDRPRSVCACFAVARGTIAEMIAARGLKSVAEIGAVLKAGTNCGSCIPELEELLRDARLAA